MRILRVEVKMPGYCLCRVDMSDYPGGDERCEHTDNDGGKCHDDHEFLVGCPLDDTEKPVVSIKTARGLSPSGGNRISKR